MRTGLPGAQSYAPISSSYFRIVKPSKIRSSSFDSNSHVGAAGLAMGGFDDNQATRPECRLHAEHAPLLDRVEKRNQVPSVMPEVELFVRGVDGIDGQALGRCGRPGLRESNRGHVEAGDIPP